MKEFKVVIGSNFGDEGKGLMTDYLASRSENGIVVRFNGGAQAGHTVRTPDGRRHAFGHFGSGSFLSLPTYLNSFFVINPVVFAEEWNVLRSLGAEPNLYVDADCMVTTPFDMLINQMAESVRGEARHGSCGLGFNETVTRSLIPRFSLTFKDLKNECLLRQKLHAIKVEYIPGRIVDLGITVIPERYATLLADEGIVERFVGDAKDMLRVAMIADCGVLKPFRTVIFEGAQGLLLDQGHAYFPHVTRSNTGMKNVAEFLPRISYEGEEVEIVYVTRAYLTRHGNGPFPTELPGKPYPNIVDETNVPNPYQGTLRFGLLDLNALARTIHNDLGNAGNLNYTAKLALTCLDQVEEDARYILGSAPRLTSVQELIGNAFGVLGFDDGYLSYGDTRETVHLVR